jgi:formylmethanofuran dehydrogenase subunit E-like metal-binding protein
VASPAYGLNEGSIGRRTDRRRKNLFQKDHGSNLKLKGANRAVTDFELKHICN